MEVRLQGELSADSGWVMDFGDVKLAFLALGVYPEITLSKARLRRDEACALVLDARPWR